VAEGSGDVHGGGAWGDLFMQRLFVKQTT